MTKRPQDKLSVLIIGCGNIAGGFDAARPADALPLTHASAFQQHGGFKLAACVEPNAKRSDAFQMHWGVVEAFASLNAIRDRVGQFDVISICSPTSFHADHLQAAFDLRPRLVFCEKPVTTDSEHTEKWVRQYEDAGVLLTVNHTRRWAPDVKRLHDELRDGVWGEVRSVVCHYNKGIQNNGGHMVDLLHYLLGPLELSCVGSVVWDYWDDDPSISAVLQFSHDVPIYLNIAHAGDYSYFELQLVTALGVVIMEDAGLHWRLRRVIDSPQFKGYRALGESECIAGEYAQSMGKAVANIHDALRMDVPLMSTGRTALQAQQICDQINRAALTGQSSTLNIHTHSGHLS